MKVLFLTSTDSRTGAGIAAVRLMNSLNKHGVQVDMLVNFKGDHIPETLSHSSLLGKLRSKLISKMDQLPLIRYKNKQHGNWSSSWISSGVLKNIDIFDYDVIHLHWIGYGMLSIKDLSRIKKPIVWTLHDMWPFTGGCHYDNNCGEFVNNCGNCPQLGSSNKKDLSYKILRKKKRYWSKQHLTLVTPSSWLEKCALKSNLFRSTDVNTIHNCLDTNVYKPIDKVNARHLFNLPKDKTIILFGAVNSLSDKRKGWEYLESLLEQIKKNLNPEKFALAVFGTPDSRQNKIFCGIECIEVGKIISDKDASLLYAASDIFVCPSVQDNFPNTIIESLACGTPVLGFKIGGLPDAVTHKYNGYLANAFNVNDLFAGLTWILERIKADSELQKNCRKYVEENIAEEIVANQYIKIYKKVLQKIGT